MAIVHFASLDDCDLVEVEFVTSDGSRLVARLLVDSGFTGVSSFVLPDRLRDVAMANLSSAYAAGALTGRQQRALVCCSIAALSFERRLAAILTDLRSLSLPPGTDGMVGLTFLRQFKSWGAERSEHGAWRFFLTSE
jgi:predicted aspartyl protease